MASLEQRIHALAQELQDEILTYVTHYEPQDHPVDIEKKPKFEPRCFHINRAARKNAMSAYYRGNVFMAGMDGSISARTIPLSQSRMRQSVLLWANDVPSDYRTTISTLRIQLDYSRSAILTPRSFVLLAGTTLNTLVLSFEFQRMKVPFGALQISTMVQQPDGSMKETWMSLLQVSHLMQSRD